ncbi:MAG: hypothetical protein Q7T55_20115, partial [Solirubrobacteraceae bacterium]|nr:hypothetical protein [Solirubrobacteraceae bacterium]
MVDAIAAAGSKQLARRAAEGAPVPFDLVEVPSSGTGAPLFSYRPRTRDFVEEHIGSLRGLMAWGTAVNVLAGFDGLGDYLLTHGERHVPIDARERADLVLRVLLSRMHEETGDFLHTPARSAGASSELARCLLAGRVEGTVIVPLLGVRLDEERVTIENGLELVRDDVVADLPREARSPVRSRPGTVIVVRSLEDPARAAALAQARPRLRALLTALRLYDQPAPALAPVAWSRMRGDGWASHPFIGTCARASGTLHIRAEDHEAIRGFCALMAGKPAAQGPAVWALRRFELACERAEHGEALTDVLLGLRALLESDHVGSGALADRLAALCAAPGEWEALRGRIQIAESLESALMQGSATDPSRTRALALELRGHLRALLRDMACGHLPDDLVEIAEHHLVHDEHGQRLAGPEPKPQFDPRPEPTVVASAAPAFEPSAPVAHDQDLSFEAHPVVVTDAREDPLDDLFIEIDGDFDDAFAPPAQPQSAALPPMTPPAAPVRPSPQASLAPQRTVREQQSAAPAPQAPRVAPPQ